MRRWDGAVPVVIVPTMYYDTPIEVFEQCGVSVVIWANQLIRASVAAVQQTAARIAADRGLLRVEDEIVSVKEIFRLQDTDELAAAEARYLP
jgi:phosphoenolpyruvate phosphomutase